MNNRERMLAGRPYISTEDGLLEDRQANKRKIYEYNNCDPLDTKKLDTLIKDILGGTGKDIWVEAPFRCDYGKNITVGERFYSNYNCTILDVAPVTIGDNVLFAPNVSLFTAGHPIGYKLRNKGVEYGKPITIGDNVWVGGNVVVNPGVTIGSNVVIGSGSVVTKDIPDNVIAAGNPCRVIREVTSEDDKYYFKKELFTNEDEEIYK